MERKLPKMYKDLLGIVSVLWMVWCGCPVVAEAHLAVTEGSLYPHEFVPQPYSLQEEVRNLVWVAQEISAQVAR